jgi:hypothetical protein
MIITEYFGSGKSVKIINEPKNQCIPGRKEKPQALLLTCCIKTTNVLKPIPRWDHNTWEIQTQFRQKTNQIRQLKIYLTDTGKASTASRFKCSTLNHKWIGNQDKVL